MKHRFPSFAIAVTLAVMTLPALALDSGVKVIGHPDLGTSQVKRATLAAVYLNRQALAPSGEKIVPVDQSVQSPVRATFSAGVLAQPVAAVRRFWAEQMSLGARPPVVRTSDADVIAFVASTPGAIGYVAASAPLSGVRELQVVD
jgi:ABC-type phosphate transport system substrate-binding protein